MPTISMFYGILIRMFFYDRWKRLQHIFNPLVGRKKTEGEKHFLSLNSELIFVEVGVHKRNVGNAMVVKGNFLFRDVSDFR